MKKLELPIVYLTEEAQKLEDSGIESEDYQDEIMTTFYLPENIMIRLNSKDQKRTNLFIGEDQHYCWIVNCDYSTAQIMIDSVLGIK